MENTLTRIFPYNDKFYDSVIIRKIPVGENQCSGKFNAVAHETKPYTRLSFNWPKKN